MAGPSWLGIFIDLSADEHARGTEFWLGLTGYSLSSPRGESGQFTTLVPPSGDDHLRVQRIDSERSGTHLDLSVDHLDAAVARAEEAGATLVMRPGHAVLRTPAGYPFCLVRRTGSEPTPAALWPDGHRSRADQLCLDIPAADFDRECAFWAELTGWDVTPNATRPEFRRLMTPASLPVRILLQRTHEGPVGGHVDIATDDRDAEIERLVALGATVAGAGGAWTVLSPPAGPPVCVTDRSPVSGLR